MLNTFLYGQTQAPLAVALEHSQRRIDQNAFPDYRGVFDRDKRTMFKFGGTNPDDRWSLGLFHWTTPAIVVPVGGAVHQRYAQGPGVPVHLLPFRPYEIE